MRRCLAAVPLAALLAVACGGATSSDIVGDGQGGSSSGSTSSSSGSTSSSSGSASSSSGSTSSSSGSTSSSSSGTNPGPCTNEVEPNDAMEKATPIGTAFCGTLSSQDDVDFGSFVLPKTSTGFSFGFTVSKPNAVGFIHVKGQTVALDGKVPYYNGETYYIEVRGKSSGSGNASGTTYRVDVNIK